MSTTPLPMTVRLPQDIREGVDKIAAITRRSRSFVISEALSQYVQRHQAYLDELSEAVAAVDSEPSYKLDDVIEWMEAIGTQDEAEKEAALLSRKIDPL
ncbi:MAG: ribbon-helix-helix protein, CopG family [Gammaproteobacteria bacterium]|nr:ribbon-helix-helix protein, CopG family [Gammaproteobacteria bacterium]